LRNFSSNNLNAKFIRSVLIILSQYVNGADHFEAHSCLTMNSVSINYRIIAIINIGLCNSIVYV